VRKVTWVENVHKVEVLLHVLNVVKKVIWAESVHKAEEEDLEVEVEVEEEEEVEVEAEAEEEEVVGLAEEVEIMPPKVLSKVLKNLMVVEMLSQRWMNYDAYIIIYVLNIYNI